jgi:hypothetical protein
MAPGSVPWMPCAEYQYAPGAQEAGRLLDARLPIPAYGQLLRLSQAFNVLDARGAVGVTERAGCFATMRGLARRVARAPLRPAASPPWSRHRALPRGRARPGAALRATRHPRPGISPVC